MSDEINRLELEVQELEKYILEQTTEWLSDRDKLRQCEKALEQCEKRFETRAEFVIHEMRALQKNHQGWQSHCFTVCMDMVKRQLLIPLREARRPSPTPK